MRSAALVVPRHRFGQTESSINGRSEILRCLRIRGRKCTDFVGRPNDRPSANAAARKENRLHGAPVIASRQLIELRQMADFWSAAEFAGHHD